MKDNAVVFSTSNIPRVRKMIFFENFKLIMNDTYTFDHTGATSDEDSKVTEPREMVINDDNEEQSDSTMNSESETVESDCEDMFSVSDAESYSSQSTLLLNPEQIGEEGNQGPFGDSFGEYTEQSTIDYASNRGDAVSMTNRPIESPNPQTNERGNGTYDRYENQREDSNMSSEESVGESCDSCDADSVYSESTLVSDSDSDSFFDDITEDIAGEELDDGKWIDSLSRF